MLDVLKEIKESFALLYYEKDWDSDGALPVNPKCLARAHELLINILTDIGDIKAPYISPLNDGRIDVSFDNGKYSLLIMVAENHMAWFGYAGQDENRKDIDPVNGSKEVELRDDELFAWIAKNMKNDDKS